MSAPALRTPPGASSARRRLALPSPRGLTLRRARAALAWPLAAVGSAALVAGSLFVSLQIAVAATIVFVLAAVFSWRRDLGVVGLLCFWLFAPALRRIIAARTGYIDADPLSLAPFVATGLLAALALLEVRMPRRASRLLLLAGGGFALGLPLGLLASAPAAVFAFVAYGAAVSAGVLGYGEGRAGRDSALRRALVVALPLVAVYGIAQNVLGPTSWDEQWLDSVDLTTIGVPGQPGKVRVFATLNAPGILGGLLAIGLLWHLADRKGRPAALVPVALLGLALALTFVRSAWVALAVAALVHVAVTRGRSAGRLAFTMGATLLLVTALASVNPTANALVTRGDTLGNLEEDESAQVRVATPTTLAADAVSAPLGHGLGTAGEASRLGSGGGLRHSDNAYLALLYQSGPLGLLAVLVPVCVVVGAAWRAARRPGPGADVRAWHLAVLTFCLVFSATGDHFYGAVAIVFWFVAGAVLGDADARAPRMAAARGPAGTTNSQSQHERTERT